MDIVRNYQKLRASRSNLRQGLAVEEPLDAEVRIAGRQVLALQMDRLVLGDALDALEAGGEDGLLVLGVHLLRFGEPIDRLHLAELLVNRHDGGPGLRVPPGEVGEDAWAALGLDPAVEAGIVERLPGEIQKALEFLDT